MIAHLDCSSGISGDKFLGALLDAGTANGSFTEAHLTALVASLAPEGRVVVGRVSSHGIGAVSVRVEAGAQPPMRRSSVIFGLLDAADIPESVRLRAHRAFEALARAEAQVHGTTPEEVHFHEVGALDSIVDVVGVCAGLEALGIDELVATPVAVGSGTVETSHGTLPIPAPATALLLLGIPVVPGPWGPLGSDGGPIGELTTPTGAALVGTSVHRFGPCPPMTPRLVGYGAGTHDIGNPNVCRILIGDPSPAEVELATEAVVLLETNLDHLSPEAAAFACEELLAEGALDVWQTPVLMKKGRAAFVLSVLCASDTADSTAARVVALTGTLGVRRTDLPRYVAERGERTIDTPLGSARVKIGPAGVEPRIRPEYDDVARIARETGRTFSDVARELTDIASRTLEDL